MRRVLTVGQRIELTIADVALGGKGVARHNDQVVFVPFVDVGERVLAEITQLKKKYAEARLIEVLEASPRRVEPQCKYFVTCAGCQYQHLAYDRQLELKRKQLKDTLLRIGGLDLEPEPVIPSPLPFGYRNKLSLTWLSGRLGLFAEDNRTIVSIDQCLIAQDEVNRKLAELRQKRIKPPPSGANRQSFILRTTELEKRLPPHSFAQVNDAMTPELKRVVSELLRPCDLLVDAYCGAGFFALEVVGCAKKVLGIELHRDSVERARREAKARGLGHVEFIAGSVDEVLARTKLPARFSLLVDPPREGCPSALLDWILKHKPAQMIYVSCNPATLARDLKQLSAAYRIERVVPLDMFPQTQHLESVASLKLTGS